MTRVFARSLRVPAAVQPPALPGTSAVAALPGTPAVMALAATRAVVLLPGTSAVVALVATLAGAASPLHAQANPSPDADPPAAACPDGTIRTVAVDRRSIYYADDDASEGRFRRLVHTVANRLHHRTREGFVRGELLFGPGDCLDPFLVSESARILRSYPFIAEAEARIEGDSVVVETQDEWTFKLNVLPKVRGGFGFARAEVAEESFWGTGTRLAFFWREQDEQRDVGGEVRTRRLAGTRADARVSVGRTRTGTFFEESLTYPFVGEVGRFAFRESYSRRESLFPYGAPEGSPFTHASLPMATRRASATLAARLGEPGDLTVLGAGVSWREVSFPDFPAGVEVVPDLDFGVRNPADSATIEALQPQVVPRNAVRALVLAGKRKIRFVARRGLDAVRGRQDVRTGAQLLLAATTTVGKPFRRDGRPAGKAPGADAHAGRAGSSVGPGVSGRAYRELAGRVSLFAGAAGPTWLVNAEFAAEAARLIGQGAPSRYRDVLAEFEAHLYWQPSGGPGHTLVANLSGAGGWNQSLPFQLTLGSPGGGMRGLDQEAFPGGRRLVLNLEDRIALDGPFRDVFDLGLTLFLDAGAGWQGDVPFGADSGLRAAAGAGIRMGFPPGSRNAYGFDVAVPLHHGGLGGVRFHVGFSRTASLLAGFGDRQTLRSRLVPALDGILGMGGRR